LQTLPENYNDAFYLSHLTEWPDLAIVAVLHNEPPSKNQPLQQPLHSNYEPMGSVSSPQQQHGGLVRNFQSRFSFLPYSTKPPAEPTRSLSSSSSSMVVGYLLGKTCAQQQQYLHHSLEGGSQQPSSYDYNHPLMVGHVSSLAVLPEFRRRGLADALLEQFHAHLVHPQHQPTLGSSPGTGTMIQRRTPVSATGLHVRRSNVAAVRLYKKWGYTPAVCIPAYYEDGEDAYYMSKHLSVSSPAHRPRSLELPRLLLSNELEENQHQQQPMPQLRSGSL
jgi:ribosomal protein S18 acetylase RimI-like enzyme